MTDEREEPPDGGPELIIVWQVGNLVGVLREHEAAPW